MHCLFRDRHADRDYLAKYADDPARLERHLQSRGPKWAANITGLEVAAIEDFAQLYGATRKSYIRLGIGFSRSRNGAVNVHAVSCLPVVTGAWQYRGGGALLATSDSFRMDESLIQGRPVTVVTVMVTVAPARACWTCRSSVRCYAAMKSRCTAARR